MVLCHLRLLYSLDGQPRYYSDFSELPSEEPFLLLHQDELPLRLTYRSQ